MSKFRIETDVAFVNESDAKAFLNHVEDIKTDVYSPSGSEPIALFRKAEYGSELYDDSEMSITDSVNFDGDPVEH